MYVPYHPRTKRLYRMIKEDFGLSIIYKKNTNSGRHPSKERPHDRETIQEEYSVFYPLQGLSEEICRTNNGHNKEEMQRTQKLVQEEAQKEIENNKEE